MTSLSKESLYILLLSREDPIYAYCPEVMVTIRSFHSGEGLKISDIVGSLSV